MTVTLTVRYQNMNFPFEWKNFSSVNSFFTLKSKAAESFPIPKEHIPFIKLSYKNGDGPRIPILCDSDVKTAVKLQDLTIRVSTKKSNGERNKQVAARAQALQVKQIAVQSELVECEARATAVENLLQAKVTVHSFGIAKSAPPVMDFNFFLKNLLDSSDPVVKLFTRNIEREELSSTWPIQSFTLNNMKNDTDIMGFAPGGHGKTVAYAFSLVANLLFCSDNFCSGEEIEGQLYPRAVIVASSAESTRLIWQQIDRIAAGTALEYYFIHDQESLNAANAAENCDIVIATPEFIPRLQAAAKGEEPGVTLRYQDKVLFSIVDEADEIIDSRRFDYLHSILATENKAVQRMMFADSGSRARLRSLPYHLVAENYVEVHIA